MNLADPLMTKEQTTIGEPTLKNLAASESVSRSESVEHDKDNSKMTTDNAEPIISKKVIEGRTNKRGIFGFYSTRNCFN